MPSSPGASRHRCCAKCWRSCPTRGWAATRRRAARLTLGTWRRGSRRRAHSSRRPCVPEARSTYDYAVIRVVPRVEREEFVNAGVIVSCPERKFLEAAIELDEARLVALDPSIDLEAVRAHL